MARHRHPEADARFDNVLAVLVLVVAVVLGLLLGAAFFIGRLTA